MKVFQLCTISTGTPLISACTAKPRGLLILQELIDRLAAEKAISDQDCQWLMYGACSPTNEPSEAIDPLIAELEDLNQQVWQPTGSICSQPAGNSGLINV